MRTPILKRNIWVFVILGASFALLLCIEMKTAFDVAAVQNAVQRDWEISFGPISQPRKPPMLPEFIDAEVWDYLFRHYPEPADPNAPAKARNRNEVTYARFLSLFRGPIREIHIYECEAFCGDLGAALARFPNLRCVTVFDDSITESEWTFFCKRLRALPRLEEIGLGGSWVTDAAIAPLATHPRLYTVSIDHGRLTTGGAKTFASIPHLTKLHIKESDEDVRLSVADRASMSLALPGVSIDFP